VCYNEFIEDEFVDINLVPRFSICLADLICAYVLDMLPYGNEIYIISSLSKAKNISILRSKNIEQTVVCISTKILSLT